MYELNHSVVNLIKSLYDEFNGRPLKSFPSFGIYFELVYTEENLKKFLNILYKEICELNGNIYTTLSSLHDLKYYSKSNGFINPVPSDDLLFLEESLVQLCCARMIHNKSLVKHLVLFRNDTPFDEYVMEKLNELKLTELEDASDKASINKKRQLSGSHLDESQVEDLKKITDELSKDYFSRWNSYTNRFYNLLDVMFKVKKFKDCNDLRLLMETIRTWKQNTEFRELTVYDVYVYRPDHTNVTKISSKTNKANRILDFYYKTKLELK